MGFRNPVTSLAADQITAGTLNADVIGAALLTATAGRRVMISTSAGDAGRIDFYGDPQSGAGEGHADIRATSYGGASSRAYLNLEADQGATLVVGSTDSPTGGVYKTVTITADYLQVLGALLGTLSADDATYGLLPRIVAGTTTATVPAIGAGGGDVTVPLSPALVGPYWVYVFNGDSGAQPTMQIVGPKSVAADGTSMLVRVANTLGGSARFNYLAIYAG